MLEDTQKVAVVISTCNRAEKLVSAVRSVVNQDFEHWRCFVTGDHCVDGSGPILLREFDEYRDRIFFKNLGFNTGKRFNRTGVVPKDCGVADSSEPLIAFLDDDNEWDSNHLSTLVEAYETSQLPNVGLVFSDMNYYRWEYGDLKFVRRHYSCGPPREGSVDTSEMLVTREAMKASGGWTKSYVSRLEMGLSEHPKRTDDWHLVRRILERGFNWVHVPEVTVRYFLKCLE